MPGKNTLTVVDNRTNQTYELPIEHGTVKATDFRQMKVAEDDFGLMSYDPGFKNTASTRSAITFIEGEEGVLRYRGYPIEQLAQYSNYLETAYLLVFGELPSADDLQKWEQDITEHTLLHENFKQFTQGFRYNADPMGMFISTVAALSTFYPEARDVGDRENRLLQTKRLIAKVPTIAACCYRYTLGYPYNYPRNDLSYCGNFLHLMFKMVEREYTPHPTLTKAIDVLFMLHMDHEQNCSATTMRGIGSSLADPYSAVAGAAAALSGPLHGGANQQVLQMLKDIGDKSNVPEFIQRVKNGDKLLMGFGHRVYKNYDPRAKIIKNITDDVFEVTGRNPLIDIARELERIALEDDYFVSRKLYPNVDFYSGIIYEALGLPTTMFPVLFAIPRTVGWLAQWNELAEDNEQKIARPRQVYTGHKLREYVALGARGAPLLEKKAQPV